jgi:hypothetical protein
MSFTTISTSVSPIPAFASSVDAAIFRKIDGLNLCNRKDTVCCGEVALYMFHAFTRVNLRNAKLTVLNSIEAKQIAEKPLAKGHVRVVGISIIHGGKFNVDNMMVFIMSPGDKGEGVEDEGLVHTCQSYIPLITRPRYWTLSPSAFARALSTLGSSPVWSPQYGKDFDELTRVSWSRRNLNASGPECIVSSPCPLPDHLNAGNFWLNNRITSVNATVPKWGVCVRDVAL